MDRAMIFSIAGHIASAIIPVTSIIAVPSAVQHFPQQKIHPQEEWGPLASTLLRASFTGQMLIPSANLSSLNQSNDDDDDGENNYQPSKPRTSIGRMDASTDEDESDEDGHKRQRKAQSTAIRSTSSRSASLSDAEKRLFGHITNDEVEHGLSSTIRSDTKQPQNAESSQSTSTATTTNDKELKRATVTITRQQVPNLILNPAPSQSGPTSARSNSQVDGIDGEARSITTARSSLNESTTVPISARSVSFKEPVIYEYDSPSSTTITAVNRGSVLDKIVIPPPEEYQQNSYELEKRNQLLNDEIQQLRLNNQNLQKQQEELLNRLQTSQKLSQRELNDLLKQSGHDQTKNLENLNQTLQNRCDQLQNELISLREHYAQDQGQSSARELKNENHFLKDYIHRLNAATSEYQTLHPPDALRTDMNKDQKKMQGLPMKGPSPIWLLNQKFLAPLFVCYDEKLHEREEFIKKLQNQLNDLHTEMKSITNENLSLHERIARTSSTIINQSTAHLPDMENIKRQAYLVLEENKVLQEQLNLQTNRLNDVQKTQIQEVSNLTRRLMIVENEKTEGDRTLATIRIKNEELRKKYEQSIIDGDHRIHVEDHVREVNEMKRITDELSEKHASEMQILLRRVQDAEAAKRTAQLKLSENRSDMERLKNDIKTIKKLNQKLQIRVQTFEKKLELQQMKEQRTTAMLDKAHEDAEKYKLEQEAYSILAKTKEDEMNKTKERMQEEGKKLNDLENRLENYKSKNKERTNEVQEQMKKQYDTLKVRCSEYEQRIKQLMTLVNEKQILIDDLNSEKRNLEVDLETIWQTTNADNKRMLEQLHEMRVTS
ncbi:unnamed protein product [Adineta steineri]|uniref:Uncharacterized protein n=1 Tax=Adineta steineri TaxID=433720 RepID=A0A818KHY6_9BILA|nr:unnamed protein product [Adineta steineri]CAF3556634.1 unnamed protein product [Adineta steineri]